MFLCKDCHDRIFEGSKHKWSNHPEAITGFGISYGPCEECGQVRECIDCHFSPDYHEKP